MSSYYCIRIEFLHDRFHGRGEGGEPEWPPSPLRLFQALAAACAGAGNERVEIRQFAEALRWLEQQPPPMIIAPVARRAQPYRLYVPNNTGDLAASAWASHREKELSAFRTEKDVHALVIGEREPLYYLWDLSRKTDPERQQAESLTEAVRSIVHLGWGVDQVVADAQWLTAEAVAGLSGKRFNPVDQPTAHPPLPAAVPGTFEALTQRHQAALSRLQRQDKVQVFFPVPRLTRLQWVNYGSDDEPPKRPVAAFSLAPVGETATAHYQAYDPVKETTVVAAMLRQHLNSDAFHRRLGWEPERLAMLHGHGEIRGANGHQHVEGPRLGIVPLPSIEWRGHERGCVVGSIRRLLLTVLKGNDREALADVAHLSGGHQLQPESDRTTSAILMPIEPDSMTLKYLQASHTWTTVTPVVLPGFDDRGGLRKKLTSGKAALTAARKNALIERLESRIEALLRKAIVQAGFSESLARFAEIQWRGGGFLPGTALAKEYFVPAHLQRFRKYHVKVTWRDEAGNPLNIPGPILLGGGRFFGLGLFVPVPERD